MDIALHTKASPFTGPSDGILSPERACAPSCGNHSFHFSFNIPNPSIFLFLFCWAFICLVNWCVRSRGYNKFGTDMILNYCSCCLSFWICII